MEKTWNSGEPSQEWPAYQNYSKGASTTHPGGHKRTQNCDADDVLPCPCAKDPVDPCVALTFRSMKTLERLILEQLQPLVKPLLDPCVCTHLEKLMSTVRVMFFYFFHCIQHRPCSLLGETHQWLDVSVRVQRMCTELLWTTLSHSMSGTI